MEKEIATFEAKCARCGLEFQHPSFGDMSYGWFLFCSEDGRDYAYCDAFDASSKLIRALLPEDGNAGMYQSALAHLADRVFGKRLTNRIRCPKCRSEDLKYWGGQKMGVMRVNSVTYHGLLALNASEMRSRVEGFVDRFRALRESESAP